MELDKVPLHSIYDTPEQREYIMHLITYSWISPDHLIHWCNESMRLFELREVRKDSIFKNLSLQRRGGIPDINTKQLRQEIKIHVDPIKVNASRNKKNIPCVEPAAIKEHADIKSALNIQYNQIPIQDDTPEHKKLTEFINGMPDFFTRDISEAWFAEYFILWKAVYEKNLF